MADLLKNGTRPQQNVHRTLVHGDFKSPNILFMQQSADSYRCAAVDFQYVGGGYGARDLVMLLVGSVDMPDDP